MEKREENRPVIKSPLTGWILQSVHRCLRTMDWITTQMAYVSGLGFLLISIFITVDILGRKFFSFSTAVADEISGYALAFGGMWALAYTLRTGGHVRIDVLLIHLPKRLQALLDYAAIGVIGCFGYILSLYIWRLTFDSFVLGARATSLIRTPLFIPQGLMALGFTVLTLEAAIIFVVGLLESTVHGALESPPVLNRPST
jgi:TRAP-type mannitol/chloroaromatic compound transport system permease small subunit